jgi:hypothetical protein
MRPHLTSLSWYRRTAEKQLTNNATKTRQVKFESEIFVTSVKRLEVIILKFARPAQRLPGDHRYLNSYLQNNEIITELGKCFETVGFEYGQAFPIQYLCQPHTPQLLFVLGGKEVGGLLVIILQF